MFDSIKKHIWYKICRYILIGLNDETFSQLGAWITYWRFGIQYSLMNIKEPSTFNEKINHIKIYRKPANGHILADKYVVRDLVKSTIGEKYLIPLVGVYSDAKKIPWKDLPNKFVMKANHGSGWNIICTDKRKLDIVNTTQKLSRWLNWNAFYLSREYQYKTIQPCIVCEELLGYNINDYKFFCFNGIPKIIQVDVGRFSKHERAFFDLDWNLQPFTICYPITNNIPQRPENLQEMIEVSTKLSKGLEFARIDLYQHNGSIYFGEITLCPEGGKGPIIPSSYDLVLGQMMIIG